MKKLLTVVLSLLFASSPAFATQNSRDAFLVGLAASIGAGISMGMAEGLGFAIPVNTVKNVVAQLIAKGIVEHPFVGLSARALFHPDVAGCTRPVVDDDSLLPLRREGAVDDVDDFDEEGGGAGGGVEDLDEGFVRPDGALFARLVGEWRQS